MHLNKIEMLEKLNKNVFKDLDESIMQLNNVSIIEHVSHVDQNPAKDISFAIADKPTEIQKKVEQPFSNSSFEDIQQLTFQSSEAEIKFLNQKISILEQEKAELLESLEEERRMNNSIAFKLKDKCVDLVALEDENSDVIDACNEMIDQVNHLQKENQQLRLFDLIN